MDFAQPSFLICLVPLIPLGLALIFLVRRQRTVLKRLGSPALIEQLSQTVNWRGRWLRLGLWLVALVLLIVALARPRWGTTVEFVERQGVEVMVILDVSRSMLAEDLRPNRLERAKLEISELMDALEGNDLGMVVFAGAAFVQFPLTSDFTTATFFLDAAHTDMISRPGTVLQEAIQIAQEAFNTDRASSKVMIILTDGETHEGDPFAAAEAAAEDGSLIYTIGFGTPEGEPIPEYNIDGTLLGYKEDNEGNRVFSKLDEATLQEIALISGGRYFRATADGSEVGFVAEEIARLQSSELESRYETSKVERFQLFIAIALALFAIAELIPDRVRTQKLPQTA